MKRSWAIIIFGILILIGIIFYSLSHRYYVSGNYMIDRFTGKSRLLRDTLEETPTPSTAPEPSKTPWTPELVREAKKELYGNNGDFSKVVISGDSMSVTGDVYQITCTVENNDSVSHRLVVKAIFYDKDNKPILTEKSLPIKSI